MNKPWLIQRANFKDEGVGSIDDVLSFDYMGSAEFEFGALPKSLKRMTKNIDTYQLESVDSIVSGVSGKALYVLLPERTQLQDAVDVLSQIASNGIQLKESSNMDLIVKGRDFLGDELNTGSWCFCDVWWDIDNDIMWAFGADEISRVLNAILTTRDNKKKEKSEGWY